jgi:hypothetical protein
VELVAGKEPPGDHHSKDHKHHDPQVDQEGLGHDEVACGHPALVTHDLLLQAEEA